MEKENFNEKLDKDQINTEENPFKTFFRRLERFVPYFFILIPGLFYYFTMCRTPGWVDATLIVSNVVEMVLSSWANTHNLFHVIGFAWLQLFPENDIHFSIVLLSALLGALTVHLMFLVFLEITSKSIIAVLGALVLMLSHSLWWHSTMIEVYTLNTAILAAMLLFLIRYNKTEKFMYLCISFFLFGLGCSNHLLMGLFVFGFLVVLGLLIYKRKNMTIINVTILVGCFLLGIGLYLAIFIRDYIQEVGKTRIVMPALSTNREVLVEALKQAIDYATGSEFKSYMFTKNLSLAERRFWRINYIILLVYNYPSTAFLFALFGFYCFWKRKALRLVFVFFMVGIAAQVVWSSNYFIWDMYAFALPVYVLFSIPMVLSMDFLFRKGRVGIIILLFCVPTFFSPPFVYKAVSHFGQRDGVVKNYFMQYPEWEQAEDTWDVVAYIMDPNKRNYAEVPEYTEKLLDLLPRGAHLWNSVGRADYPLRFYYRDLYGKRKDIKHHTIFNPFFNHVLARTEAYELKHLMQVGSPVYIASLNFPERMILDNLYVLMDSSKDLEWVSELSIDALIETFPEVEFKEIVLIESKHRCIYRMDICGQNNASECP